MLNPLTHPAENRATHRIVYIVGQVLAPRDYIRFGIPDMLAAGIAVSVVDLANLMSPTFENRRDHYADFTEITMLVPRLSAELAALGRELREASLIAFLAGTNGVTDSNLKIARLISKSKTPYLLLNPPVYPGPNNDRFYRREGGRLFWAIWNVLTNNLANSIIHRLPPRLLGVRDAAFVLDCCPGIARANKLVGPGTRRLRSHAFDFELFIEARAKDLPTLDQAVFIDQFMAFHPDMAETKNKFRLDPEIYYGQLNTLFARIERELGLEVVIAGHPRGLYADHLGIFERRRIVMGQTPELILQSRLVMAQTSTAIGLAVMADKPLMLLISREVENFSREKPIAEAFSRELEIPPSRLDDVESIDIEACLRSPRHMYERYIRTYIVADMETKARTWNPVIAEIVGASADQAVPA